MSKENWGKCLGYTGEECESCGRVRVEKYENRKTVCEKCGWCKEIQEYVDRERMYER